MKVAFLCEGYSEYESIPVILSKFSLGKFQLLKRYNDVFPGENDYQFLIYRHNYKGTGKIRKEFLEFSKVLIDNKGYSKIFIWFDNECIFPICEYARLKYNEIDERYKGQIELVISVEQLENWLLSNANVLNHLFSIEIDKTYLNNKGIDNFLALQNVDTLNAGEIIRILKKGTSIEHFNKQKIAARFFNFVDLNLKYNSFSFSRFLKKISEVFLS